MSDKKRPHVRTETEFAYMDKFAGKQRRFTPKSDEIMATFKDSATPDVAVELMRSTHLEISQGVSYEHGFAALKTGPGRDAGAAVKALEADPRIANAMPVMIDGEGLVRYFLPDEFTVQFRNVNRNQAEETLRAKGCAMVSGQRTPGYYTASVPEGKGLFETIAEFNKLDTVQFAEPSEVGFNDKLLYLPDDPEFPKLWGLHNTGQVVNGVAGVADADIDCAEAWDWTRGDPDVIVAIIDTGADLNHPDLQANILPRGAEDWDFADPADGVPDDMDGHGTHVAGTVAAVDNVIGVVGVAPKCRLMPLRVNLTTGMNQNRADAINYVAAQSAADPNRRFVINCSWKMNGDHAGVHNAIINAVNNNVVVVYAAGNANVDIGVTPQYPAVYPEVIAVAATDQSDHRASFSNYGAPVSVSAPGVNIYSTFPDDTYTYLDGTSMASPHVAGIAALIRSRNHTLNVAQVRSILESSCDDINARNPGFAGKLGRGRVNAYHAVKITPAPPLPFRLLNKYPFPQKNAGSSSALGFARRFPMRPVRRTALLFLTQQPWSERIYYLNPLNGAVMGSVDPVANDTIGSLEFDGRFIRVANVTVGAGFINSIDPVTGAQVASMPVPPGRGEGMAIGPGFIYYSTENLIHVINIATGAVVRSFAPPGGTCHALAWGRGFLFSGNSAAGVITVFDAVTLVVHGTIAAPGAGAARVEGLAFDALTNQLFIANQSENTIYVGVVTL